MYVVMSKLKDRIYPDNKHIIVMLAGRRNVPYKLRIVRP